MKAFRVPRRVTAMNVGSRSPPRRGPVSSSEFGIASSAKHGPGSSAGSRPLKDYHDVSAYVLLGEPGSGKTTAFDMEYRADPEGSERVTARDFATLDLDSHPEWREKTLFIDGLDEMRTAASDWGAPLDSIRNRLERLGHPRFRISCRAGEWLGENDAAALKQLVPAGEMAVLRLDPLDQGEMRTLLEERVGRARAHEFMSYAREHGLRGFLQHPLHIELLLEAGIGNRQISSRRSLFESACKSMSRDKNPAHRAGRRGISRPSETALLDASGRLCALSLLTDTPGWSVDPAEPTPDYPSLCEIENADSSVVPEELDGALRTRLFRMTRDGRFEPIHRQVAEFLAGRFLGRQVEERNLSPARLRAVMASDNGAAAPSLRGLAAWIAAHNPTARSALIRDDPIGVASYGDPSEFAQEDQERLISCLRDRARHIDIRQWPDFALPSLATPGALPIVCDIITAPERDDATQQLVYLALRAIAQMDGSSIPRGIRTPLLGVARDLRWLPGSRAAALKAWIASASGGRRNVDEAVKLLKEIRDDETSDPRGSLAGLLLGYLYPKQVTPERLWEYARSVPPSPGSGHLGFWKNELPRRSDEEGCLAEVLNSLRRWLHDRPHSIDDSSIRDGVVKTFALALRRHGDETEAERLYDWSAAAFPWIPSKSDLDLSSQIRLHFGVASPPEDTKAKIDAWLQSRPDKQKALISEIVRRQEDYDIIWPTDSFSATGVLTIDNILAGTPVTDFAFWFLEQAVSLSESRPMLACDMLRRTGVGTRTLAELPDHFRKVFEKLPDRLRMPWEKDADSNRRTGPTSNGLTLDEIRARISGHSPLEECLKSLLAPPPQPNPEHPLVQKRARKRKQWIDWVREDHEALSRGESPPSLYHEIAKAYLGENASVTGNTPEERVHDLFLGDEKLQRMALDGLRRMARRADLPTLDDLIRFEENGSISYFVLPLLAAMEERDRTASEDRARLGGGALQLALGSLFFARGFDGPDPAWYRRALRSDAEDVADAFVRVYRSRIRRASGVDRHLRSLTRDESHAEAARVALPRLLRSFPAKATANQVFYLDYLIPAALEYVDRDELASIVHRKLELSSLRVSHRIRWLATGMLIGDPPFGEQLDRFLAEGSDARVRGLAAFLKVKALSKRIGSLSAATLAMLVRRLGGCFAPRSAGAPGYISHSAVEAIQTGGIIRAALDALSHLPSPEATELIHALVGDYDLAAWRRDIAEARDIQRIARLDAEFVPPTIPDVLSVLEDGRPASAADLTALVVDRIVAIGEQVRDGNANMWRHFWNEREVGKPKSPKVEPSCQMALLNALRPQLPEQVGVEPEASYAGVGVRRADLQVSFRDFAVPVETKVSSSRDLWTAASEQLIPRYTRDPKSGGHGVYVVFWHGTEFAKKPTPRGKPPRTPGELEERLTQQLTTAQKNKVRVVVLDVSQP